MHRLLALLVLFLKIFSHGFAAPATEGVFAGTLHILESLAAESNDAATVVLRWEQSVTGQEASPQPSHRYLRLRPAARGASSTQGQVDVLADATALGAGTRVEVTGRLADGRTAGGADPAVEQELLADSIRALPNNPAAVPDLPAETGHGLIRARAASVDDAAAVSGGGGAPATPISTLFLLVSTSCAGARNSPAASKQDLEAVLFDSGSAVGGSSSSSSSSSAAATLQSYVAYCSHGRAALSRDTSRVLDGVVIPCAGPVSAATGQPAWLTSRCQTGDMLGWGDAAVEAAKQQLGGGDAAAGLAALAAFKHVVLVLPQGWAEAGDASCAGLTAAGEVGIPRRNPDGSPSYGLVWISAPKAAALNAYLHELLHNLGQRHPGTPDGCAYCDATCALGYCCDVRCPNAPHMAALGWADPVPGGALALEALPQAATLRYRLPAQGRDGASFVAVDATGGSGSGSRYFLSYRVSDPSYDVLDPEDDGAVHVHAGLLGTARSGSTDSLYLGRLALGGGGVWRDDKTRLTAAALGRNGDGAVVALCRAPLSPSGAVNWAACDLTLTGSAAGSASSTANATAARPLAPPPVALATASSDLSPLPAPQPVASPAPAPTTTTTTPAQATPIAGNPTTIQAASHPSPLPAPRPPLPPTRSPAATPKPQPPAQPATQSDISGAASAARPLPSPSPPSAPGPPSPTASAGPGLGKKRGARSPPPSAPPPGSSSSGSSSSTRSSGPNPKSAGRNKRAGDAAPPSPPQPQLPSPPGKGKSRAQRTLLQPGGGGGSSSSSSSATRARQQREVEVLLPVRSGGGGDVGAERGSSGSSGSNGSDDSGAGQGRMGRRALWHIRGAVHA